MLPIPSAIIYISRLDDQCLVSKVGRELSIACYFWVGRMFVMAKIDYYRQSRKHPNTLTPVPKPISNAALAALPHFEPSEIEFILYVYKTQKCNYSTRCTMLNCKFFHDETDQRRVPSFHHSTGFNYSWRLEEGGCLNRLEQVYHPMIYKTKLCDRRGDCDGKTCPYAHGTKQLRHPEVIYKIQGHVIPELSPELAYQSQYLEMLALREDLSYKYEQLQRKMLENANRLKCSICHSGTRTGVASCCGALICQTCTQGNEDRCKACGETGKAVITLVSSQAS